MVCVFPHIYRHLIKYIGDGNGHQRTKTPELGHVKNQYKLIFFFSPKKIIVNQCPILILHIQIKPKAKISFKMIFSLVKIDIALSGRVFAHYNKKSRGQNCYHVINKDAKNNNGLVYKSLYVKHVTTRYCYNPNIKILCLVASDQNIFKAA